jgi:hypothetical protein
MPIATTVVRPAFNPLLYGTVNLRMADTTGVSSATPLTIAGDLVVSPLVELPYGEWRCEVITMPVSNNRLIIRIGDTVTG